MKRVLFMSEEEARTTLYCAGLSGNYEMVVVGNPEKNKTIQHHPMCHKFVPLKTPLVFDDNSQNVADELLQIIESESIDILLPVSITCLMLIDRHQALFEEKVAITPFPSKETVDLLDNKFSFYEFCLANDIPHPKSVLANQLSDIDPESPGVDYPILIKPLLGAGGFNTLVFLQNQAELEAFKQKPAEKTSGYFPALVQEFFEGEDIDFNGFSVDGEVLASSVMRTSFYENDRELYFTDFVEDEKVIELGEKILNVSGYTGPTNIDMRIRKSDGKLMLIEVNPRYWARVQVSLMDGMNFLDIGLKSAEGKKIKVESRCSRNVWVSSLSPMIKAIVTGAKLSYIKYLFSLSKEQIKLIIFTKKYKADLKSKGLSLSDPNP